MHLLLLLLNLLLNPKLLLFLLRVVNLPLFLHLPNFLLLFMLLLQSLLLLLLKLPDPDRGPALVLPPCIAHFVFNHFSAFGFVPFDLVSLITLWCIYNQHIPKDGTSWVCTNSNFSRRQKHGKKQARLVSAMEALWLPSTVSCNWDSFQKYSWSQLQVCHKNCSFFILFW